MNTTSEEIQQLFENLYGPASISEQTTVTHAKSGRWLVVRESAFKRTMVVVYTDNGQIIYTNTK